MKENIDYNDLISIIIPIYKVEKYINECLDSILNQTYTKLEILLIDDGSPDESGLICDKYASKDNRIKVIHKKNEGVSSARNTGLDLSNGKYVCFVDADDFIEKNFCEKMLNTLKKHNADCVACGYNRIYKRKKEKIIEKEGYELNKEEFLKKLLLVQSGLGFCHTKIWKRSVINEIRFNEDLKVGEDALFCIEVGKNLEKFYMLNDSLYNYRYNENSVVREFDEHYVDKYLKAMKITKKYIERNYQNDEKVCERVNNYISYHLLLVIINYCMNPKNGLNFLEQSKKTKEVCNITEFKEAIEKTNYCGFSITRKITIFTLKHKLYLITVYIGKIRQIQFKKNEKGKKC